jgi:hypothetical protein
MKDTSFVVKGDTDGKDLSPLSTAAWDLVPCNLVLEIWTTRIVGWLVKLAECPRREKQGDAPVLKRIIKWFTDLEDTRV